MRTVRFLAIMGMTLVGISALGTPRKNLLTVAEPNQQIARGQAKRLLIIGFAGSVIVTPNMRSDEVLIKAIKTADSEDASVNTETLNQFSVGAINVGDTIEVKAQPNGQTSEWAKWGIGHHGPEVRLEVYAPPTLNLEVFWTRGDVKVSQWKAPVFITNQEGHLDIENNVNDVTLRSMQGSVKAENIKGSVSIENFGSSLTLNNITGKVKVRTFSGDAHIKKFKVT